jgi:hypothetical protein
MRSLPEIEAREGRREWRVKGKLLAWERPLRRTDLAALGKAAPKGSILAVHVPLDVKEMLLESEPATFFTTPHFDGYPAILLRLGKIRVRALRGLLEQSWRERAPKLGGPARRSRHPGRPGRNTRKRRAKRHCFEPRFW